MDTECDVDRSAGRGFNLGALYAVLMLFSAVKCQKIDELYILLSFYHPQI